MRALAKSINVKKEVIRVYAYKQTKNSSVHTQKLGSFQPTKLNRCVREKEEEKEKKQRRKIEAMVQIEFQMSKFHDP